MVRSQHIPLRISRNRAQNGLNHLSQWPTEDFQHEMHPGTFATTTICEPNLLEKRKPDALTTWPTMFNSGWAQPTIAPRNSNKDLVHK